MLTLPLALRVLGAAQARAEELGVAVNVSILDAGGHLKAFARMDSAILASIDVAMGKARTAVLLEARSEAAWDYCKPGGPAPGLERSNGGLVTFGGGIPIRNANDKVIGAVGVSGGTVDEDLSIADAALAASAEPGPRIETMVAALQQGAR